MSALEQIVVTGCPTCGAPAQAIAEGEGVRYRHVDTATLKAVQGGVTEAMVEDRAREMYEAYRAANPDARMYPWEWQPFKPTLDHWRFKARVALEAALSAEAAAQGNCQHEAWEETGSWCKCVDCGHGWSKAAPPAQPAEAYFPDANALADWLESLHECHTDGAVGNRKWEAAQIAAKAVRGAAQPAERVPDGWSSRRYRELAIWYVRSPSGDEGGVYDRAAGVHAELLRQLAQDLAATPAAPAEEGDGKEGVRG